MKIVIAGGSGLVGQALAERLSTGGGDVVILSREPATVPIGRAVAWGGTSDAWKPELRDAAAVVNLAGSGIADKRWSESRKRDLRESRIRATRALADAMIDTPNSDRAFVSASAVGYYGSRGDDELDETSPPDGSFLSKLSAEWEGEAFRASVASRVVVLRLGVVLSTRGGALAKMLPPFRLGLGGRLGSGAQWMSWIHIDDLVSLIEWAIATTSARGVYNATAPNPVTNAELTRELGRALRRPTLFTVPSVALSALLGDMAGPLLLTGQKVMPRRALAEGLAFGHESIEKALPHLLGTR